MNPARKAKSRRAMMWELPALWSSCCPQPPNSQTRLSATCRPRGGFIHFPVSQHPAQCFTCRWNLTDGTMINRRWDLPRIPRCWNLNFILLNPSLMTLMFSLFPWHKYMFTYHSPEIYENFFTFSKKNKRYVIFYDVFWCLSAMLHIIREWSCTMVRPGQSRFMLVILG